MFVKSIVAAGLLASALALSACNQSGPAAPASSTPVPTPSAPAPSASGKPASAASLAPAASAAARTDAFALRVDVSLSKAAAARIAQGETIIVDADYFGDPKPGTPARYVDQVGQVDLGNQQVEMHAAGSALIDGSKVMRDRLDMLAGDPQVNINVWSGRKTSPDNLLGCDMFQGTLKSVAGKPIALACHLLSEPEATGHKG